MMHRTMALMLFLCGVAAPTFASAQDLFAERADMAVDLVAEVPGPPIAVDAAGYAWYGPRWAASDPNRQVTCVATADGVDAEPLGAVWLSVIQPTSLMPGGYKGGGYAATAPLPDGSG